MSYSIEDGELTARYEKWLKAWRLMLRLEGDGGDQGWSEPAPIVPEEEVVIVLPSLK